MPDISSWLSQQVSGQYMKHVCDFVELLSDPAALANAGFILSPTILKSAVAAVELEELIEDEFSDTFALLCMGNCRKRVVRGMQYFSWPFAMFGCLWEDHSHREVTESFRCDQRAFIALQAKPPSTASERLVCKRHLMNLRANKQYVTALDATGNEASAGFKKLLRSHTMVNVQTQLIEDVQGQQKNAFALKACRRFRKPAVCMAVGLEAEVIAARLHFEDIVAEMPLPLNAAKLPTDAFTACDVKTGSMDFSSIVSVSASTEWWSSAACNLGIPAADLSMVGQVSECDDWSVIASSWIGEVADLRHQLVAVGFGQGSRNLLVLGASLVPEELSRFVAGYKSRVGGYRSCVFRLAH